jgi:hypothetical protein
MKILALIFAGLVSGCSLQDKDGQYLGQQGHDPFTGVDLAYEAASSTNGRSIERRIGLLVAESSLSDVMEALPKHFSSPAECDRWLKRWLLTTSRRPVSDFYAFELNRKYHYSSVPIMQTGIPLSWLPRNGLAYEQDTLSVSVETVIRDAYFRIKKSDKDELSPNIYITGEIVWKLGEANDGKWANETIYWLTYLASGWPEHLSSEEFGKKNRESNKLMWQGVLAANPARHEELISFTKDGVVTPCFDWCAENPLSAFPISEHAFWYYVGLRDRNLGLNRETALFWAVVLTVRFKSAYGAAKLQEFREKHALKPDNDFWREATLATAKFIPESAEKR